MKNLLSTLREQLGTIDIGDTFKITECDLNNIGRIVEVLEYRTPSEVTDYIVCSRSFNESNYTYEMCPKCGALVEYTYQHFCQNCGQQLKWISRRRMNIRL